MITLGVDLGIASVGWGLIDRATEDGRILGAGVWMFDAPETDKERRPKSEIRREKRGLRRVIRRRRQRMAAIRRLLAAHGLLTAATADALKVPGLDPWAVRVAGLDRRLDPLELAVALGHLARHRGFRSTAKRAVNANAAEDGKVKAGLAGTKERLAQWGSVAEMMLKDPAFAGRYRNREGDYSRSIHRDDLEAEARLLFQRQRTLGQDLATEALAAAFLPLAFDQRPRRDSEDRVGPCPFVPTERRTARHGYSFELFRLLSRLAIIEITAGHETRRLTAEEISAACADFGATAKISFTQLRRRLGLGAATRFVGIAAEAESRDVVSRSGQAAAGSAALRAVLGAGPWTALSRQQPALLDRIAEILSFREDLGRIRQGLEDSGVAAPVVEAILADLAAANSRLAGFSQAGHISAQAARALIPLLARGLVYSEAVTAAGWVHTDSRERSAFATGLTGKAALGAILRERRISEQLIGSPVARKALLEALKQIKAIIEDQAMRRRDPTWMPDAIHVELAREVGKSIEERRQIETGIEKRTRAKDRLREELAAPELLGRAPTGEELLRYELWKEQNGRCVYSGEYISPTQIVAGDNSVQVDHILPWSRFGDDSFANKTLCLVRANQNKRDLTPHEWLSEADWPTFVARVEALRCKGMKKRNYLLKDGSETVAERFRNRNLVDTRWASRLLAEALRALYPAEEGKRRVFARPGPLTDRLRRGWGLQGLKKDADGQRIPDDRHHALDALIVAATDEAALQRLTQAFQQERAQGGHRDFGTLTPPWPGFRDQVIAAVDGVFVARAERRRARGEAHAATIRQIAERDGTPVVFERKRVADLTVKDLERLKDAERNHRIGAVLRDWIDAGKPEDAPPVSPQGHPIVKVRLATGKSIDLRVRGGTAENSRIAAVDVFRRLDRKGRARFLLVPIYPHQIVTQSEPPDRAVVAHKPEEAWDRISPEDKFLFRLYPHSYIVVKKPDGSDISGYFKGVNTNGGQLKIAPAADLTKMRDGIGSKTLLSFEKHQVDRLGRLYPVQGETRTWRGKACT